MAVIHFYNGINKKTTYTFNGRLRDNIQDVDWEKSIILRGGFRLNPDYEVQPDDVIFIRKTPADFVTFATITSIVMVGTILGEQQYKSKKALNEMEAASKAAKAGAEQANKLPYLRGTRNQPATGQSFPFAIGESLMTPYRLCPMHYTIAGDKGQDQYCNAVLEIAFNDIFIKQVKMGETVIKSFTGSTPQNGQYSFDQGVYYDENNLIEIRQTGAFTDEHFNTKIICTDLNKEIPHRHATTDAEENAKIETEWKAGIVQELPTNAKSVELIALFDGLQEYKDGSWGLASITLSPQWTNVNNPQESDWHNFDFDREPQLPIFSRNQFVYNTNQQMRFIATKTFTAAEAYGKQIKIRIRRLTPKADSCAKDTVYLQAVQTTCYDPKKSSSSSLVTAEVMEADKRDQCCRIGVRIKATENTNGLLDAISVVESGCARTWNGSAWSETKTPTSNLAAWALEILTNGHHKPSQYNDNEIDLESFGDWYDYCDTEGFKADGVITTTTKKKNILDTLCANSNAALVYNRMTGLIEAAIDNGRDYSVALLNSENIINISTTKEFKRKTDGKKVKYINAAAGYDVDSVIFMRNGGDYNPATDTLSETALQLVTSYEHAFKIAWRQMAEEMAQPRTIQIEAGFESAYYPLFSRVDVQHKTLKNGLAHGVIKSLVWNNSYLQKIILDGSVTFPQSTACGVIINCVSDNGHGILPLKVSGTGKTSELEIITTLRNNAPLIPSIGNILSFGELDLDGEFTTVTSPMKITDVEETTNGFTLTLVDYNEDIYEYGTLPTYKSNITTIPDSRNISVREQRDYMTQGDAEANASEAAQAAVDTVTTGHRFTNVYKLRAPNECLEEIIAKMDDDARNASASISISEDEILLQVENTAKGLRGLIDIQAGSVQALVEGGGASGQMSLTLNLPTMIDATKRAELIAASTEEKVNDVYGLVEGTEYYAIKANAGDAAVKALWDDAVNGGLIASQIELQADQIYIGGDVIVNSSNKIKAALLEVDEILTKNLSVKDKGALKSANYNGTIDADGNITAYGSTGWAIDHAGKSDFVNINANGGTINQITATNMHATGSCYFEGGIGVSKIMSKSISGIPQNVDITEQGAFLIMVWGADGIWSAPKSAANIYLFTNGGTTARTVKLTDDTSVSSCLTLPLIGSPKYLRISPGSDTYTCWQVVVIPISRYSTPPVPD